MQQQAPAKLLRTNRSLIKTILLSVITFGIYGLVVNYNCTEDLNTVATRYDGKKTMNYLLMILILAPITLGIYGIVWQHKFCNRLGAELKRRNVNYEFSAKTYWGWGILGSLIIVGPFVFGHKYYKAMNLMNGDFNVNG
ncbi:MAG: DUF4234 domain-containing protein [Clostridia bacterium]|nr:DUF4234 domain-containing protein [Clostridia bacterium]